VADEKTRVLSSAEAARLFTRKPKVVGDKVVFYCDNGHRVVAPIDQAGKRGTCSKCGVPLMVPQAEAEAESAEVTTILAVPRQSAPEDASAAGSSARGSGGTNGPAEPAFATQAGAMGEVAAAHGSESEEPMPAADASGPEGFGETWQAPPDDAVPAAAATAPQAWQYMDDQADAAAHGESADAAGWPGPGGVDAGDADGLDNPTARLVARLWVEHKLGGTLELHLQDGSVIFPQSYEPRWSLGTHGLFAAAAPDGSITLTAVAWESVQKVIVRNVKGLPDGMFE
jgi:hypothetical protein